MYTVPLHLKLNPTRDPIRKKKEKKKAMRETNAVVWVKYKVQWQLSNCLVRHREAIFPWLRLRLRHLSLLREFQWSSTSPTERSFSVLSAMTSLTPLVLSTASSSFRYLLWMRFRNFEMQFSFKFSYRPNGFPGRRWTNAPRYWSHRTLQVLSLSPSYTHIFMYT